MDTYAQRVTTVVGLGCCSSRYEPNCVESAAPAPAPHSPISDLDFVCLGGVAASRHDARRATNIGHQSLIKLRLQHLGASVVRCKHLFIDVGMRSRDGAVLGIAWRLGWHMSVCVQRNRIFCILLISRRDVGSRPVQTRSTGWSGVQGPRLCCSLLALVDELTGGPL